MNMSRLGAVAFAMAASSCHAQVDPRYAINTTVYHLNPASAGAIPINMDTGDARGDLYFYLGQFLLPLECANQSAEGRSHFDCDNPERTDPNLVVTKVDLTVDSRPTKYSACNLCNGTDPFSRKPCDVGSYVCDCFNFHSNATCDPAKVGNESIHDNFVPKPTKPQCKAALTDTCGKYQSSKAMCNLCTLTHKKALEKQSCGDEDLYHFCPSDWGGCTANSPSWMCWAEAIPRKTGGYWYSTLAEGECKATSSEGSCGWKALSSTTVKDTCLKGKIIDTVEKAAPACFQGCGVPRNTSSSCWIKCFFDTVLGPKVAHNSSAELGGLPIDTLETAWESAFAPVDQGGCPRVDVAQRWSSSSAIVV